MTKAPTPTEMSTERAEIYLDHWQLSDVVWATTPYYP